VWNIRHFSFPNIIQQLTFSSGGKFWTSREPFLDENAANVIGKPTLITRGLFHGYSLPIWDAGGNAHEELHYRLRVPHRWDGVTAPSFYAISSISANELVDSKYKVQAEWVSEDVEHVMPDTTSGTETCEITCSTGKNAAYYAQILIFEADPATIVSGQNIQIRVRRIAASADEVANEIIIYHWDTRWLFDKIGKTSPSGY
jgi:hypothetical protein